MSSAGRPCVFFDRDGIVNRAPESRYVTRWEDFHLNPEFVEALREVRDLGLPAVVVTNQKCVAVGIMTEDAVRAIHQRLMDVLRRDHAVELLDILFCPHGDDTCACRKPNPGMLLEAARRHGIDLAASWMIGDQPRDVEAGCRAGCRTILVAEGPDAAGADHHVQTLDELVKRLPGWLKPEGGG
ncbi:MAG: hypothetical protein A2498_08445 [Lentisphaerae bacterium RIFOXYC12_FULL_60_16]|nr:MAG: hypothetical protein A2498_08445 [Lentisphaerae bacterium RIFOXYC12_FULL_60_16]